MKKLVFLFLATAAANTNAMKFVHPLDFENTDSGREQVEKRIKHQVKQKYNRLGFGKLETVLQKEQEELDAFKQLTKSRSRRALDSAIKKACHPNYAVSNCGYTKILTTYENLDQNTKKGLNWD